jgi:hypothetical protein
MNRSALTILFIVMVLGTSRCASAAPAKWEYKLLSGGHVDADTLNNLGKQGWELVAVESLSASGNWSETIYYFKRPLSK